MRKMPVCEVTSEGIFLRITRLVIALLALSRPVLPQGQAPMASEVSTEKGAEILSLA